jgi:hypothetical protein
VPTPRHEGHPGLDQSSAAERPWTAHRSSIPDERDQIVVDEQWIVVDGPGSRALRQRQTDAIRDVLRWLAADRADQHNPGGESTTVDPERD